MYRYRRSLPAAKLCLLVTLKACQETAAQDQNVNQLGERVLLADGSKRLLVEAKVTSYSINQPIGPEEFR